MNKTLSQPASAESQDLVGQVLGGKYRIESVLGRGGMGVVYRGKDLDLKRHVAVKVLHAVFSRNQIITRRFEREARSAAGLSHPNIVQVHDSGETTDGLRYLVMELLEGRELKALLGRPMPPNLALRRAEQILSGLAHAHSQGIIHRDLKPENVFVTQDHLGRESIKLVDFGVAKIIEPALDTPQEPAPSRPNRSDTIALTQAGLIFGTPTYMSPEQATGTPVDPRSDLYSFGVILYEMLTGRPPLYHEDPICLIRMQVSVSPPPLDASFGDDVRGFVHCLLAKERDERFQQSSEALEELRALVAETPEDAPAGPELTQSAQDAWVKNTQAGRDLLNHKNTYPGTDPRGWRFARTNRLRRRTRIAWAKSKRWCVRHPVQATGLLAAGLGLIFGLVVGVDGLFRDHLPHDDLYVSTSVETLKPSPSEAELAELDRAFLAKDFRRVRQKIAPLLDLYPESGDLLWRQAKVSLAKKDPNERILALYTAACKASPALLENSEFYREIYEILTHPSIKSDKAIEAAMKYMGPHGHQYLLGLINKRIEPGQGKKNALSYAQRHQIIDHVSRKPESERLIDWDIQLHWDLLQAHRQRDPCQVFLDALAQIEARQKTDYFLNPLHEATVPRANPKNRDPKQATRCKDAQIKLNVLREVFEETYGDGVREKPIVTAQPRAAAASSNPTLKKPAKSAPVKKKTKRPKAGRSRSKRPSQG